MTESKEKEYCNNCMFYIQARCRRHSPSKVDEYNYPIWPHVMSNDWCGDYERKVEDKQ